MNIPITQSATWQKLQDELGEVSYREKGTGYQYLAIYKSTPVANYLYLPYGPVTEDRKGFENALKDLKNLAARKDITFIRIEPQDPKATQFFSHNTRKTTDLNPKETWQIDLAGDEADLKQKLPSRLLRYYKAAAKKGITIETSNNPDDIQYLIALQKALAKTKKINTFSEKYLRTELSQPFATLYLAKYQDPETKKSEVVAAGLVFDDRTMRYNVQGAQNDRGRKLHATGILTIQLILDAKAKGLKAFDFWGIAPEGASKNHPWAGFTNFKKTFTGQQVDYAGTYDIILKPFHYRFYQIFRKLNRMIRK